MMAPWQRRVLARETEVIQEYRAEGGGREVGSRGKTAAQWRTVLSGDIPQMERIVQCNGTTYTLHLPTAPQYAEPQPDRTTLMIAEVLVIQRRPGGKRRSGCWTYGGCHPNLQPPYLSSARWVAGFLG